jgi:hypothetical protein
VSKLSWLRSLLVPVFILSLLLVACAGYYLYWVPNRQRHLDDRGFRYLKTLSDQIRLTINSYDKMLDNAADFGIREDTLDEYLHNVAPQLVVPEKSEREHVIDQEAYDDPPRIAVKADEGTHFLYLAFKHEVEGKSATQEVKYAVRTDLDKLVNGLLGPPDLSPFDVVLVVRSNGKVIFQNSLSGIEVAQIKSLEDASGVVKGSPEKHIDMDLLSPTSRLEEVKIAGARYRLYSQPLQIGFLPAPPPGKSAEKKSTENVQGPWVLCGMVRADRFRSESQLIPYAYILMVLAAILLAATAYPFLRLYLSNPGERMRARDVTIAAVLACLATAVVTVSFADAYYWNIYFGPTTDGNMAKLADAINKNFEREKNAAYDQLEALEENNPELLATLQQQAKHVRLLDNGTCDPPSACRVSLLADPLPSTDDYPSSSPQKHPFQKYPYLFFVSWSDPEGNQLVKWTTRKRPTPFVPLDDPSVPYYPEVKRAFKSQGDSLTIPPAHGIGSQYSPTTGQNITLFWRIHEDETSGKKFCASLVTQPISLFNAVLHGGFQFAVLTPDGTVVFHSDPTRNLRENFFAETDQDTDLRSRVGMRAAGPVVANYMGRPHRMYVRPMDSGNQDGPWTVVVFRDLHLEETMNLEILSLVSIMFLLYAGAITLVLVSAYWIPRGRATRNWLWPDSRRTERYVQAAVANGVAVALVVLLSRFVSPFALLLCSSLIPAAVLVMNLVIVARRDDAQGPADETDGATSARWQFAYFIAAVSLLVVVVVLPCLCFFKVTASFEHRLFVEHMQLRLADDLENRALSMQLLYGDVSLGTQAKKEVLGGPEGQHAGNLSDAAKDGSSPVFSYHELLDTSVCREPDSSRDSTGNSKEIPDCHAPGGRPNEDGFLSGISLSYNEGAADDRHLAEDTSAMWKWTLSPSGRRVLMLTMQKEGQEARVIASFWEPFYFPWDRWSWWLCILVFLAVLYGLVRLGLSRIFLLNLKVPPVATNFAHGSSPASLMADLPMDLLIIGPESSRPISDLIERPDVQVHEARELLEALNARVKPADGTEASKSDGDQIERIIQDGRPLVLRNFSGLPNDADSAANMNAGLLRALSGLGNSVIILSDLDPSLITSIEESERWRSLLRSFVRIDLNTKPPRRVDEDDADYQGRVSADSYFHWLFSGLSRKEKLVMLQLAQENVVNPNSFETVSQLMEQGMIERRWGLLVVTDNGFATFLKHAISHDVVKTWEKHEAGTRPASLQWSLAILGIGVAVFLIVTQGALFNTWVTYATGAAAALPKFLQALDSLRPKSEAKA